MKLLLLIRGATRPIATIVVVITACILAWKVTAETSEVPVWFVGIVATISAFWFSDRRRRGGEDE
jgi:hypothetical protein